MKVNFKEVQLHNFSSYADVTLELSNMGFTLVEGRNKCKLDNAYSNGSGKSALFNGICFALTGETLSGVSSGFENIFTNPNDCWVKLTLNVNNDEFVIKRIKTPKQGLEIKINGIDYSGKGIRESSQVLANYIPDLTSDVINGIIMLGQGLPRRFTNNKPSHRKEMLENLTKSDFMIQAIKDKLEIRSNSLKSDLHDCENNVLSYDSKKSVYKDQLSKIEEDIKNYSDYISGGESIDDLYSQAEFKLKRVEANLKSCEEAINNKKHEINNLESHKSTLKDSRQTELNNAVADISKEIYEVQNSSVSIKAEILNLEKEITKLKSITDICPTCKQKIPDVIKPDTAVEESKLTEYQSQLAEIKNTLSSLEDKKSNTSVDITQRYSERISSVDDIINDVSKQLEQLFIEQKELLSHKEELIDKKYELFNLKENYNKLISDKKAVNKNIKDVTKQIAAENSKILDINSHLDIVQQLQTLAKREFRGILLSNIIRFIDKKVKQYSLKIFGTDKLAFTLNENYIDITYCDKLYENLSGGEKQKIDIIVQLALRDILSKQLNIHFNILVLDEIYDNLDSLSCQKLTELVSELTDIDSIFIISHHAQDLEITCDSNILVNKSEEGISTINYC